MSLQLQQFFASHDAAIQGVADTLGKGSILLSLLPVKSTGALIHKYGSLDYGGGVDTRKINEPRKNVESSSTSPKEEKIIIAGGAVKVDVRMQAVEPTARATEIARKTRVVAKFADDQILQGTGLTADDRLVGFQSRATGNQLITAATNGAAMTLALFNQVVDAVEDQGGGRYAVMNLTLCRKLKNLILAAAGGATVQDVAGGMGSFKYEEVTIVPALRNHLNTALLPFTENCGTSNVCSSVYCFAPGAPGEDFSGVQLLAASNSIEVIQEGIVNSQHVDVVEFAFGLAVYQPLALARLKGITNA
jgi:hypothetical protein